MQTPPQTSSQAPRKAANSAHPAAVAPGTGVAKQRRDAALGLWVRAAAHTRPCRLPQGRVCRDRRGSPPASGRRCPHHLADAAGAHDVRRPRALGLKQRVVGRGAARVQRQHHVHGACDARVHAGSGVRRMRLDIPLMALGSACCPSQGGRRPRCCRPLLPCVTSGGRLVQTRAAQGFSRTGTR